VSASYENGRGIDRWDAGVDLRHSGRDENVMAGAVVGYYGNRFEARVSQSSGFNEISADSLKLTPAEQRSSARLGTAIVFADGRFGIAQPIRGNGFAILYPHESIAGKAITVGDKDDVRARSDWLGAAVIANIPAYTTSAIPIDVDDLPVGYSLGTSTIETFAPYRAGYTFEIGSAYSVSAYGTLLLTNGEPVSLLTGTAFPIDRPEKQVTIFTNASGRFGAEGLAPGKWVIEMATEGGPTRYEFEIPRGADGLFRAGDLRPVARS
jgi:outer membrane usher protein